MGKISDEIREFLRRARADRLMDLSELDAITDRIDAVMVELPKDADGVPIHVGDTMYMDDGRKYHVSRVNIVRDHTSIDVHPCGTGRLFLSTEPTRFTHARPDSLERIADELDAWCDRVDVDGDACDRPRDLADRIRKLAKEQGNE